MQFRVHLENDAHAEEFSVDAVLTCEGGGSYRAQIMRIEQAIRFFLHSHPSTRHDAHRAKGTVSTINGKQFGIWEYGMLVYAYDRFAQSVLPGECPAFRSWLEVKPPTEFVGYSGEGTKCPIEKWVEAESCVAHPFVGVSYVTYTDQFSVPVKAPLPPWAQTFIRRLDNTLAGKVTAREVLGILNLWDIC